ncbi:hypothetical protein EDB85DRAFT_1985586 [Lactarius pseudohatsudake]|nr:hypothetical protein EDB85DRAFT_1985586 [Lactarius pseudohatsudake]
MRAIETSLKALKEASTLASKAPFIGPIAGIILEALKMRGEVKQLEGEWGAVMQKLAKVGNIVVDIGEWYQANDMSEDDLPSNLRNALKSLRTDLDGIQDVLEECAKVKGFRRVLLRSDILTKVKQYDAKLTHAFQVFHTRVTLGNRLAQIVQEKRLNSESLGATAVGNARARERMPHIPPDGGAGSAYLTEPLAPMPSAPQTFFGRDAELAQIIEMIFANTASRPARIAILGPGGYGKTKLADAVLDHPRVREHYRDARYKVICEPLRSSADLLIQLAKTLGVSKEDSDFLWSRIRRSLIVEDCVICFDNFESPWDQSGDIKASVEDLLSKITDLHHVTVIITMRGTESPARTQWTQPTLAPLKAIDSDAVDLIMTRIKTSLSILKDTSSLASKVPCVSQIAGMLLYAIQLHGEVRQFKEEWEVVANKLADVANIVIKFGRSYEMHELGEEDLVNLQIDLQYLQRGLEGVEEFLKVEECAEYPGVERVLQLEYIQTKVKLCHNMLSHALDDLKTKVARRTRPRKYNFGALHSFRKWQKQQKLGRGFRSLSSRGLLDVGRVNVVEVL